MRVSGEGNPDTRIAFISAIFKRSEIGSMANGGTAGHSVCLLWCVFFVLRKLLTAYVHVGRNEQQLTRQVYCALGQKMHAGLIRVLWNSDNLSRTKFLHIINAMAIANVCSKTQVEREISGV